MKTFHKTLAIVLALVMCLNLICLPASAEDETPVSTNWLGNNLSVEVKAGKDGYTFQAVYRGPYAAYEMSHHMVTNGSKRENGSTAYEIPQTLVLVDASRDYTWTPDGPYTFANSNYEVLYCCDAVTGYKNGAYYKRMNLEDSTYYSKEEAAHIRGIVTNSYPFVTLNRMKQILKANGFEGADEITRADAIAAVQAAIWAFANESEGIYYYGQTFHVPTSTGWGGAMHDYSPEMDIWWNTGAKKTVNKNNAKDEKVLAEIIKVEARINALIDFLRQQKEVYADENQVVITDLQIRDCVPVQEKDGHYTVALQVALNNSGSSVQDDIAIDIYAGDELVETRKVQLGTKVYDFAVELEAGQEVKAVMFGTQVLPQGVYFYEPEGGRDASQSLVGVASGETDVYSEAKATIPEFEREIITADIKITKVNEAGEKLTGASFDLYAKSENAEIYVDTYSVKEDGTLSIEDLLPGTYLITESIAPADHLGLQDAIEFIVTEQGEVQASALPDGVSYVSEASEFVVTNRYAYIDISGSKTWDDNNNQDGKRPESITVNLLANGQVVDSVVVTEADEWKYIFENLPRFENSVEIEYTITEEPVEGYTTTIDGFNVTNSYTPEKTGVSGTKTWDDNNNQDGKRPESITINLLANGEKVSSMEVTEADGWKFSFTDLSKYADGEEIEYTITEEPVEGYTTTIDGFNVTNSYTPEKTGVSGTKTWDDNNNQDGKRPESITINLLANGQVIDSVVVNEADDWKFSFTDLDKYANGEEIVYTVTEDAVAGYTATIDGFNVINTYIPEEVKVNVNKVWDDDDDFDGKRPISITINLFADGEKIGSKVVTAADGWKVSFENLPKYSGGKEIVYTITEDEVAEYTSTIAGDAANGYTVTNSYLPEIDDEDPPLDDLPGTGDSLSRMLIMTMVCTLGFITCLAKRKQEN